MGLPQVGQKWKKEWLVAGAVLRSLRDGRDAEKYIKFIGEIVDADAGEAADLRRAAVPRRGSRPSLRSRVL